MTEDDAIVFWEFVTARSSGWDLIFLGRDGRTRAAKVALQATQDLWLHQPRFKIALPHLMAGGSFLDLVPDQFRPIMEFRLHHAVPRDINEPLSSEGRQHRRHFQGMDDWPWWLNGYAKPATVADHPPFPPLSDLYHAWRAVHSPATDTNIIMFPTRVRSA